MLIGFYPTGKEISANGFKPSGALIKVVLICPYLSSFKSNLLSLIKAMLIHSAQSMDSILDGNGGTVSISTPSAQAGYGRIQLDKGKFHSN